jgi:uncharacterized membrane protein YoaK (UPF0700 family)
MSSPRDTPGILTLVLLALTVVTGLIDAVSYLGLGRVFTANMTGNLALLGFAAAGAPGLSVSRSGAALAAFLVGAADLTTTVLTLTITGLGADSSLAGGTNANWARRLGAVFALLAGAAVGAWLVRSSLALALGTAATISALCGAVAYLADPEAVTPIGARST